MKRIYPTLIALFITLSSFASDGNPKHDFIGTYGVSVDNPSQISLQLNEDGTFTYRDYSNPENKIDVTGSWELKGHKVVLGGYPSKASFHNKWKFKRDGRVAKSRKGMTFYSLCKSDYDNK